MTYLQDTKMEFALSIGTGFRAWIALCLGDKVQRGTSRRVVGCEREVGPIDDDGEVVPAIGGERGREQHIQIMIQDLHVLCVGGREISRWIGKR